MAQENTKLFDTKAAAAVYGITICRINQLAAARGVTPLVLGGINIWTSAQVKKLKPLANGRPRTKGKK